jgi:hypothetical protein
MGYEKPADYIEVKDRLPEFFAKFPEGSLTGSYELVTINGNQAVIYTAKAYRTPDDPQPGVGTAYEAIPGSTPYTRGSEIQNAETAAWGRAMIATGAVNASKGVASAEEIRPRIAEQQAATAPLTPQQEAVLSDWKDRITDLEGDREGLLKLHKEASAARAGAAVMKLIVEAGNRAKGDQS